MLMFLTKEIEIFGEILGPYRHCFSKPQWNHFLTYISGLLLGGKGEKNIQDISENLLDGKDQSSLNRFITKPHWDIRILNNLRIQKNLHERDGGILSLDDTIIEKTGKRMDGVGYLYDPSRRRNVLCHDVVSTFYRTSSGQLPLYFEPYVKKEVAENCGVWFRTKIQIAVDLLRKSLLKVNPAAVVFDEWYMCRELLDFLSSRGLTWVSQAKTNRCIFIDGVWINLTSYVKTLPHKLFNRIDAEVGEKKYKWFYETTVMMRNVGLVKLVILKRRRNSKRCVFLVSNNITLSGLQVLEYYKNRWCIEVFHRDCKQHLGLGEYQVRKLDAVVIHLHLVFFAYTLLKNVQSNPVLNTILKEIKSVGSACRRLKRWIVDALRGRRRTMLHPVGT
jgi:hypothetical protein